MITKHPTNPFLYCSELPEKMDTYRYDGDSAPYVVYKGDEVVGALVNQYGQYVVVLDGDERGFCGDTPDDALYSANTLAHIPYEPLTEEEIAEQEAFLNE